MRILRTVKAAFVYGSILYNLSFASNFSDSIAPSDCRKSVSVPNYKALMQDGEKKIHSKYIQVFFGKKAGGHRGTLGPGYFRGPLGITADKRDGKIYIVDF